MFPINMVACDYMSLLLPATIFLCVIFYLFYWKNRQIFALASQLPGPPALPLIGNGLEFICKNEDVLGKLSSLMRKYSHPMRLWAGTTLTISFTNPSHVEKILLSSKFSQKHKIYNFMKNYLGEGLITASGPVYKKHKKLIQPMLSLQFFTSNYDVFGRHGGILVEHLYQYAHQEEFDILPTIHKCFVDIVGETILGTQIRSQEGFNSDFVDNVIAIYNLGFTRLIKPWLYPDIIYNFTPHKKLEDYYMTMINSYIDKICKESVDRVEHAPKDVGEDSPIVDQISAFRRENPEFMDNIEFRYHMFTLYAASEDTISTICAFAVVCLGLYPEYQSKLAKEVLEVVGKDERPIRMDDLRKLQYLDMCIKDVLRLFPIGPYILRESTASFQLDKWYLPKGISVLIPIFDIHRDGTYWKNPNHFYPDHFRPEEVSKRPFYSYLPFSAGPRGCIGKTFVNIGLKVILATIIKNFEIEAQGTLSDLKLRMDISTRSVNGYRVKLKRRSW